METRLSKFQYPFSDSKKREKLKHFVLGLGFQKKEKMAPPAKHNKSEVDRLSSLPESLLLQILSLMETRFAVQTSILSTRYRHLWTFLPNLSFDSKNFPKLPSFDKFVTHVITHHDHQSKVSSISYDRRGKSSKPIIKVFKHIVSQQSIEHLKVSGCIGKIGDFVSGVFNCQSLQTLQLENCMSYFYFSEILRVPANFCLPSLTTLYLESVRFPRSDKVNNECSVSFSECPNLKNLTLISLNICHLKLFHLVCSRVENLTYTLDNFKLCGAKVVLTAPKLTHFNLEGPLPIRLYFDNVSSLEVADIGGTISSTKFVRPLIHMLNKFSNLKCVTISSFDVVEVLSKVPSLLEHLPSPFLNVKSLKLKVYLEFISSIKLNKVISFLLDSSTDADVVVEPLRCSH